MILFIISKVIIMNKTSDIVLIEFKEVTPHTILTNYKEYFDLNAAAVILNSLIIVIDTLVYPRQAEEFREKIEKKYGLPVKYLFITHYHSDHIYGVAAFKDIEIFGSYALIENIKERKENVWTKEAFNEWKNNEPEMAEIVDEIKMLK